MAGTNGAEHKASSSLRPKHQIGRSISELSPIHLHRHHHTSNHGSHSRNRDKQERASERDDQIHHTRSAGPSAILQPRTSLEVPRWEGADTTGTPSPDESRRTSALIASGDEQMGATHEAGTSVGGSGTTLYTRKLSRDEELQEERRKAAARASGLKKSLVGLSAFSNATTRRLDDTYYSVLEKLGMLQHTIVALKELAETSQETSTQFERESNDMVGEITSQINSFGGFGEQERRIQALTERIHGGRDKVKTLSERVDVVRERIEAWERADREWQERTRRRLKAIWVVTSVLLALLLILLVAAQYIPANAEVARRLTNASGIVGGGVIGKDRGSGVETGLRSALGTSLNRTTQPGAVDERLRVFDEL
ncbi:hypothetical protein CONLIGDRAFT_676142 [Coniochaeta ligniaria NRRL 30616]|uniref:Uncharacterized protein n=1 Tax=Coniochaeta ligniaria NRRL 30616 TaxID=1408157 RepID=A0A1J7J767_9PEZI|nr:hypothetical protein CONLIGDRAFT_676142 [Coniochaeta ligniaria NRRL 30616]